MHYWDCPQKQNPCIATPSKTEQQMQGKQLYNKKDFQLLLSGKSFSDDKNKAETLLQDFSLFCYFACWKKTLVT